MYTGIVQGVAAITRVDDHGAFKTITVGNQQSLFDDVELGASVAIDGVCLTVTRVARDAVCFDVSHATKQLTTLKHLVSGSMVNVERSYQSGKENGGHSLYGHIEGVAKVVALASDEQGTRIRVRIPAGCMQYFFHKGFLGLHGCSLTIHALDRAASVLELNLIPETLRQTNLQAIKVGDELNFEVDQYTRVLVDTLVRLMQSNSR